MWMLFGLLAMVMTLMNLYRYRTARDSRLFMFLALAFTALTVTATNNLYAAWVRSEAWVNLMDVVPTMTTAFWVLVSLSILLNGIPLVVTKKRNDVN